MGSKTSPIIMLGLCMCLNAHIAHAFVFTERVCKEYGLGRSWYCTKEEELEEESDGELEAQDILALKIPPEQKAVMLNELWQLQLKRAVITEDRKDLKRVLETQRLIAKKGVDFARNMQNLIETTPAFSNEQSYLVNIADQLAKEEELKHTLLSARQTYAIAFVYKGDCIYCKRQLSILLSFKEKWHIPILGISVDGKHYPDLPESITDTAITSDPSVQAFPTIILLNKKLPKKIFISKGLTTMDQLEEKIFRAINQDS